jgi:predicted nucleic acid-binding protein
MVRVFVDTSALYALLDEDDANHDRAARAFAQLQGSDLTTHAYVLVETLALVSTHLGWEAVVRLLGGLLSVVEVGPVDAGIHNDALAAYREAGPGSLSFVDRTSFSFMRTRRITGAFAFDDHFESAGFERIG